MHIKTMTVKKDNITASYGYTDLTGFHVTIKNGNDVIEARSELTDGPAIIDTIAEYNEMGIIPLCVYVAVAFNDPPQMTKPIFPLRIARHSAMRSKEIK